MTTEELKIKVSLETQRLKQELRLLKQAFKDVKLDSKNKNEANELNRSLERVEDTLRDIDRLDFGDNLARGINKAKAAAKDIEKSTKGLTSNTKGMNLSIKSDGLGEANDQIAAMQETLEAIMALNFTQLLESFGGIKDAASAIAINWKDAKAHLGAALAVWLKLPGFTDFGTGFGRGLFKDSLEHFKLMFSAIGSILTSLAKVSVILGTILLTVNAIKRAAQVAKEAFSAERIGMDPNEYGEWAFIANQTGAEDGAQDLYDYVRTLSDVQNQLREGSEDMVAIYKRLGMSAEEVSGMSQGEMFARTIEALQNVQDEVERTSLAYKIFGEDDAAKVTTLLNTNSAEIERLTHNYYLLGGAMSGQLIENSKILRHSLNNLSTAWTGLKNTLAEVFLPIIIPVVQWLTRAVAVVNMFIRAIFGKEIVSASTGIEHVASAYTGYRDSADQATNSTNRVTEAIERLKRVTMGFDELNKLPGVDKTGSSSSGTGGNTGSSGVSQLPTGGGVGGLDIPTVEDLGLDGIANWIDTNKQKIQDITALLLTLGGIAIAAFCFLHGNIPGGLIGLGLAGIGISIGNGEEGIWTRLGNAIKAVCDKVQGWFTSFVEWLGGGLSSAWEKVTDFLHGIGEGIASAWEKTKEVVGNIFGWFIGLFTDEAHASDGSSKKAGKTFMESFSAGVAEAWDKFKKSPAGQFFAGIGNKVVELKAKFVEIGSNVRKTVSSAWSALKNKTATLTSKFKDGYYNTRKRLTDAWGKLKSKTATLTGKFKRSGYYETLNKYWDKFKTKTSTLTVAFKDAFTSKIKAAWNGLVKAINKAITTINKIPGVNIPKLPQLATGGIVTGPTTALIGEAGKEAVLPLERNTGWMDALADKIAAKNGSNNSGPSKIVLTVDGKQLGWATIDNINSITKQTGVLPLNLV